AVRLVHRLQRFVELLDRLLRRLLTLRIVRALLLRRLGALLALLPPLAALPGLLLRLRDLLLYLLELFLELLGLAPQLLLLPAILLAEPVAPLRLLRELFLPACELLQLLDRVVDLVLASRFELPRRLGFVLVLLQIHLELVE